MKWLKMLATMDEDIAKRQAALAKRQAKADATRAENLAIKNKKSIDVPTDTSRS
jgi:hypothetical protein